MKHINRVAKRLKMANSNEAYSFLENLDLEKLAEKAEPVLEKEIEKVCTNISSGKLQAFIHDSYDSFTTFLKENGFDLDQFYLSTFERVLREDDPESYQRYQKILENDKSTFMLEFLYSRFVDLLYEKADELFNNYVENMIN